MKNYINWLKLQTEDFIAPYKSSVAEATSKVNFAEHALN